MIWISLTRYYYIQLIHSHHAWPSSRANPIIGGDLWGWHRNCYSESNWVIYYQQIGQKSAYLTRSHYPMHE